MSRNLRSEAIVLKAARMQEFHKSVNLLLPALGVVQAVAYGAYKTKGKLGSVTDPFVCGTVYLYFDPVKKSYKITELEPLSYLEGIRGNLEKWYTASLIAEVVLRSFGGEGQERVYELVKEALFQLDAASESVLVRLQFVWRFIGALGFMPDIESCEVCGRTLTDNEGAFVRLAHGDVVCVRCAERTEVQAGGVLPMSSSALHYLVFTGHLSLTEALAVELDAKSRHELVRMLHSLIQEILEVPLLTLKAGVL